MRRALFIAALGAVLIAVAAPLAAAQGRVVNVYNWSDYIDPEMLKLFTKETGIKVVYDTFDANETLETKLLAGKSGYDVVVPTAYFLQRQIMAGVFSKLDKSKLPNLANEWPEIGKRLAAYDPGNQYGVNYMWGTTGIGYNVKAVHQRLGPNAKIDSWDAVFKPEIIAKFKDCGVHMLDSADIEVMIGLARRRQVALAADAFPLGARLLAEPAGALCARWEAYWTVWRDDEATALAA